MKSASTIFENKAKENNQIRSKSINKPSSSNKSLHINQGEVSNNNEEEIFEEANPILAPKLNKQRVNRLNSANIIVGNLKTLNIEVEDKPNQCSKDKKIEVIKDNKIINLEYSDSIERMSPSSIKNIHVKKLNQFINFSNQSKSNEKSISKINNKGVESLTSVYNKVKVNENNTNLVQYQNEREKEKKLVNNVS